jgi:gluconolactonase
MSTMTTQRLRRVAETDAHEGPVYAADEDALYFTTVRRERVAIKRLALADGTVTVVRADDNTANGMALDRDGVLVVCEQGTLTEPARIARVDRATGAAETVVDGWEGLPLNSPNDVVVAHDGDIWFTDPSYGHLQGFRPEPRVPDRVYRHDPRTGRTTVFAEGFDKPNGLAFSPTSVCCTSPTTARRTTSWPSTWKDGSREVLAVGSPGHPDRLKVDDAGRIYASSPAGVQIMSSAGEPVGQISLPGAVNFAFGGRDGNVLFITTDTAVWAAELDAKGA